MVAKAAASAPTTAFGRRIARVRAVVFGRPLSMAEYFDRDLGLEEYQRIATRVLDRSYELEVEARGLFFPKPGA